MWPGNRNLNITATPYKTGLVHNFTVCTRNTLNYNKSNVERIVRHGKTESQLAPHILSFALHTKN
jgi:hypothetical protein